MYLNDCSPGGSCPICNAIDPPEMVHIFTVWEAYDDGITPEDSYGLIKVITQDDPDDLPYLWDLVLNYEPDEVGSMPGFENPTLTLDQIREIAELGRIDGELLTSEEL